MSTTEDSADASAAGMPPAVTSTIARGLCRAYSQPVETGQTCAACEGLPDCVHVFEAARLAHGYGAPGVPAWYRFQGSGSAPAGAGRPWARALFIHDFLSTGIRELDEAHAAIDAAIAELLRTAAAVRTADGVAGHVDKVASLLAAHFRAEERIMAALGLTRRDDHEAEHRRIERRLRREQARLVAPGGAADPQSLARLFGDFHEHVLSFDSDFRPGAKA